jgi:hypothetical protein
MDYSSYEKNNKYYAGSEEKFGLTIDGHDHIVKFQKPSETGLLNNTISEYIGCHIFDILGMHVQNTYLGTYEGRNVVLMEDFVKENQQFVPFNEVGDSSLENDKETYQYSYTDIMQMLEENTKLTQVAATITQFWHMYIIDALLGNFDRHGANWGFIKEDDHYTLAPIFDNGSCLFPRIHSDEACLTILENPEEIDKRIYSFPTSQIKLKKKKSSYFDVISSLQYPECNKALQEITGKINLAKIDDFVDTIGEISDIQKRFYKTMIKQRFEKILWHSSVKLQGRTV